MPSPRSPLVAVSLLLALLPLLAACGKDRGPGRAPQLTLKDYDGVPYTFGPDDGKVTLVVFWATWCVPCIEEIPHLKDFEENYAAQGFRVVSINIDDPEGHTAPEMMRQFEINYPVLVEVDEKAEEAYGGLRALPTSFLVGRDGRIKRKLEGLYPAATVERFIVEQL
jgi:thiol-disulfide isomerase/thioredoxin